jgi:hypothetical protein
VKHREESSGSELVERLRRSGGRHADSLENEAADRIEELERALREGICLTCRKRFTESLEKKA